MKIRVRNHIGAGFFLLILFVSVFYTGCSDSDKNKRRAVTVPTIDTRFYIDLDSIEIAKKAKELDKLFIHLQKRTGFNGTVLYAEKGRVIFQKAYGFRNVRRHRDSLRIDDAFQLASVSKMFSAMAIMILKNDGRLNYDEDIRTYLPDFPYEGVTCRLLMNHRSGLPRYMSLAYDKWPDKKVPMDNDDMMDLFVKYHPDRYFKPNTGFHYCNTNYALLANIVEAVSGRRFEDFMKDRIFDPLGMDHSFVYNMRGDTIVPLYIGKGVPGYYRRGWRWREMENDYLNGVMGDKNIYTSVTDLYKYDRALDELTLLPDSILREAFKPGSKKYWKRKNNYGFGWRLKDDMDSTAFHFGWWKGFRTFYIRDMKHRKTLIVLSNKDKGPGSANFWNIIKSDTLMLGPCESLKRRSRR
ncbi:MAG: beta-lactamase family protein [Chlorobi bacterium]|nr:beta-lactamase family protein [Chlorobiota bacterium]